MEKEKEAMTLYPSNVNVHMLIAALKEYGINNCVLSPGTSNAPIVHLMELDNNFNCYSIVDERDAGFFALGLAQMTGEPVVMCCTSGTAGVNYAPAMHEAFFQNIPIIAITADRSSYYEYQMMDQKVPQTNLYEMVVKKEITLPYIRDDLDWWYCNRVLNEALIGVGLNKRGPIHINVEMDGTSYKCNKKFEKIQYIKRDEEERLEQLADQMADKKLLIIWGQNSSMSKEIEELVGEFEKRYNCVIATENISNLHTKYSINLYMLFDKMGEEAFKMIAPDYVISVGGQYISRLRECLIKYKGKIEHWIISEDGNIVDHLKKLSGVMHLTLKEFLEAFIRYGSDKDIHSYYEILNGMVKKLPKPDYGYSNNWAMQQLYKRLPKNSILHLGIDSIVRASNSLHIDSNITVYSNRGTTGIEGAVPTFVGQACACGKPAFLVVGDLSFFYGMNGIWNAYISSNVRIMLCNNGGGETFYWNSARRIDTKDKYIAAAHKTTAKGWVETMGFTYLSAKNIKEYEEALEKFLDFSKECPMFLELFTDKRTDAEEWMAYERQCQLVSNGWSDHIISGRYYVIYGTGKKARATEQIILNLGGNILCYCVTTPEKKEFLGKPVVAANDLPKMRKQYDKIIISSSLYYEEIKQILENIGFEKREYLLISE